MALRAYVKALSTMSKQAFRIMFIVSFLLFILKEKNLFSIFSHSVNLHSVLPIELKNHNNKPLTGLHYNNNQLHDNINANVKSLNNSVSFPHINLFSFLARHKMPPNMDTWLILHSILCKEVHITVLYEVQFIKS